MSSTLPKEIMDKEQILENFSLKIYGLCAPYTSAKTILLDFFKEYSALHYSQIIEQKDKEIDRLKEFAKLYDEYIQQKDGFYTRKQYEQRITNCIEQIKKSDTEIEQLKAENESLKDGIKRLKELAPYHISPYNLGDMGEILNIIQKL